MIDFDHVTKTYDDNIGLDDVSIHIDDGEFVFIVGPSGAGKSTFIKLILKEINADTGSIIVNGSEVTTMSNRMIPGHRKRIGIVFQNFRLLSNKTVFENVAFAMEITHQTRRTILRRVPQALDLVGIGGYADRYPDDLSAGEQQRVAIARAIVNQPTVLIADEPTGNLDPDTAWEIMKLLERINQKGTTILMVTHAKDIVDRMNKRVIAIDNGKIIQDEFGKYDYHQNLISNTFTMDKDDWEDRLGSIGIKSKQAKKAAADKARERAEIAASKKAEREAKLRAKQEKAAKRAEAARARAQARIDAQEKKKELKREKRHAKGDMNLSIDEIADALAAAAAEAEIRAREEAAVIYGEEDHKDIEEKGGEV